MDSERDNEESNDKEVVNTTYEEHKQPKKQPDTNREKKKSNTSESEIQPKEDDKEKSKDAEILSLGGDQSKVYNNKGGPKDEDSDGYVIETIKKPSIEPQTPSNVPPNVDDSRLSSPESTTHLCNKAENIVITARRTLNETFPPEREPYDLEKLKQKCKMWREICDNERYVYPKKQRDGELFWEEEKYSEIKKLEAVIEGFYDSLNKCEVEDKAINDSRSKLAEENEEMKDVLDQMRSELEENLKKYKGVVNYSEELEAIKKHLNDVFSWNTSYINIMKEIEAMKPPIRFISDEAIKNIIKLHKERVAQENKAFEECMKHNNNLNRKLKDNCTGTITIKSKTDEIIKELKIGIDELEKLRSGLLGILVENCKGHPSEEYGINEISEHIKSEHEVLNIKFMNAKKAVDETKAKIGDYKKKSQDILNAKREKTIKYYEERRQRLEEELISSIENLENLKAEYNKKVITIDKLELEVNKDKDTFEQQQEIIQELDLKISKGKDAMSEAEGLERKRKVVENQIMAKTEEKRELFEATNELEERKKELNNKYIKLVKTPSVTKKAKRRIQFLNKLGDTDELAMTLKQQYIDLIEEKKREQNFKDGLQLQWNEINKQKEKNSEYSLKIEAKENELEKLQAELVSLNNHSSNHK